MARLLIAVVLLSWSASPASALSEMGTLVQYDCEQPQCDLKCWGTGGDITLKYKTLTVFQWKDHVRRLWISVNNEQYVLGDDTSCNFKGRPTFKFPSSPLGPPPTQPCVCIGNQCNPPGVGPSGEPRERYGR